MLFMTKIPPTLCINQQTELKVLGFYQMYRL